MPNAQDQRASRFFVVVGDSISELELELELIKCLVAVKINLIDSK